MEGRDRVTMFNMNRYITKHLVEKLDKSEYQHEDTANADESEEVESEDDESEEDDDDSE